MQEHNDQDTVRTTGRGYNRHATDASREAAGAATDLYSPVPGDDDQSRPGVVGGGDRPITTSHSEEPARVTYQTSTTTQRGDDREMTRTPSTHASYATRPSSRQSDGGVMQKIQDNPLAVVAAATAAGLLVGRMMRNRGHRHDEGYLRGMSNRQYQFQPYQQPSRQQYQGYPTYPGYRQASYQMPSGYQGVPQYRSEQTFRPDQSFEGRHENFPGGSNWD